MRSISKKENTNEQLLYQSICLCTLACAGYPSPMPHFVYIARCNDGTLYTGTCVDLRAREARHNAGSGAKYTRGRRPVQFVYHEKFPDLSAARSREAAVKRMTRVQKEELVRGSLFLAMLSP